jgi:hypothetical protein
MTDKQLDEVLKELGREHRAIDAPHSLERGLYAAAESRKSAIGKPRMQFPLMWAAAAILLAAIAGVTVVGPIWRSLQTHQARQPDEAQTQQAHSLPAPRVSPEPSHASPVTARPSVVPKAEPAHAVVKPRAAVKPHAPLRPSSLPHAPTSSSLDAFVPLPASESLPTASEFSIVRIRLRGSDLQQYGLQTPADAFARTMLAEFAVGEDGLPRAIRIVR